MNKDQRDEFEALSRKLIEWMNENMNPHAIIIISTDSAVAYSGEIAIHTDDYIKG